MKNGLTFIILLFLLSCGQESSKLADTDNKNTPFNKFIYLDSYYTDFLKTLQLDPANRDKIYSEKIKDALMKDHFSKSEYADLVLETFSYPIQDTTDLTKIIADLNSQKNEIETIISSVYSLCNWHLKNDSVTFYIVPSSADIKELINKMGGVTGQTAGSKQILLIIDFNINTWKEVLEYTVAHEFNHSYWTSVNLTDNYKWTLLRYLVFEGKADSFAHLLYPNVKVPWTCALNEKEKTELWNRVKPDLQSDNPILLSGVMFGSNDYPVWGGYTLGYDIVQTAFSNNPDICKTNWTNLAADKLIEQNSYK